MSIRSVDGKPVPLVGDGNLVPTPSPPKYETHAPGEAEKKTIIYKTHHGKPNHVPLSESSKTELHRAVLKSDPATLADLLEDPTIKAKIDAQDIFGHTALHLACQTTTTGTKRGQKDPNTIACAQLLIEQGANTNLATTEDQWSQTPLMFCVSSLCTHSACPP